MLRCFGVGNIFPAETVGDHEIALLLFYTLTKYIGLFLHLKWVFLLLYELMNMVRGSCKRSK